MKYFSKYSNAGFTLIEMLVVIAIVGILAAIAAPSWQSWLTRQRLNSAQAEALSALRETQGNAKREKRTWQVCFREVTDNNITRVQWSSHPLPNNTNTGCGQAIAGTWKYMLESDSDLIQIDSGNGNTNMDTSDGAYRVQFDAKGMVSGQLPKKISFVTRNQSVRGSKRCVSVETILGALRTASDQECGS